MKEDASVITQLKGTHAIKRTLNLQYAYGVGEKRVERHGGVITRLAQ